MVEVGRRLRVVCGAMPVARLGGDEFAAIAAGDRVLPALSITAEIRAAVEESIDLGVGRPTVRVGASSDSASGRFGSGEGGLLLEEADRALYHAKLDGRRVGQRERCPRAGAG